MKNWTPLAISYLDKSLGKISSELNEIDWNASLSPNYDKLCRHIAAFANLPGGGFLAFSVNDKIGKINGITKPEAEYSQKAIATLFGVQVPAISKHLKNIFESGELEENSVISILETTADDGQTYQNESVIQKHIDALKRKGYIERKGETTGHWIIKR